MKKHLKFLLVYALVIVSVLCALYGVPKYLYKQISAVMAPIDNSENTVIENSDNLIYDTWKLVTWNGYPVYDDTFVRGSYVWQCGNDVYLSAGNIQYKLNQETKMWDGVIWNGFSDVWGVDIWCCDGVYYYSNGIEQYRLNTEKQSWQVAIWNGIDNLSGRNIWFLGDDVYYSSGDGYQYKLNKSLRTFEKVTWNGFNDVYGVDVFVHNGKAYYCVVDSGIFEYYELDSETQTWQVKDWEIVCTYSRGYLGVWGSYVWEYNSVLYCDNSMYGHLRYDDENDKWVEYHDWNYDMPDSSIEELAGDCVVVLNSTCYCLENFYQYELTASAA